MSKPDLHKRFRKYLRQFKLGVDFTIDEKTWTTVPKLKQLALGNGYRLQEIRSALAGLHEDVDVAIVWDRDNRCERVCLYELTDEERRKAIESREWFDSLPDGPPKK
ncbi:MAG: hypothetical protein Tp172MES00d2C118482111_25 [Prokaryotic dsDNA virus sp.]|nr:MAG: hypothetical protein Tp172MES00d2C118482111_25 [Prokaryotic dsDNA virus sp.]|tara:strand:- start:704 stop:1024 length:321 start_codon:yes stop_codon:yes gene_type:complete